MRFDAVFRGDVVDFTTGNADIPWLSVSTYRTCLDRLTKSACGGKADLVAERADFGF
jgi:hypothetical protein